jgi:hypothetical protein
MKRDRLHIDTVSQLPDEVWVEILSLFSYQYSLWMHHTAVCRQWHTAIYTQCHTELRCTYGLQSHHLTRLDSLLRYESRPRLSVTGHCLY